MDPNYFEPRGEYVLESEEEPSPQFKSKPPKNLEHVVGILNRFFTDMLKMFFFFKSVYLFAH